MNSVADIATPERKPACWDMPEAFAAEALDYHPRDEAYRHLDLIGHTMLQARKEAAEEAAVDVCFGCPLMLACEEIDEANIAKGSFVAGVIGGRTEAERKARRDGTVPVAEKSASLPNPQIAPGDRGPRNQVDDDLVVTLTKAGKTSGQIADTIGCSPRTVTRARKRAGMAARPAKNSSRKTQKKTSPRPATDAFAAHAVTATAKTIARAATAAAVVARHSTATHHVTNPFIAGRQISAAMEAVYNHLATSTTPVHIDTLIEVGSQHVDPAESLEWWTRHNTVNVDGKNVLRGTKAETPKADRIREGARLKVRNAISATYRKGRYLIREGNTISFEPQSRAAWQQRMSAQAVTTP